MSESSKSSVPVKNNMVRARVAIRGIRPLLQHAFGADAIPLEKRERTGVAGNDPEEWKRSCMVTPQGQLYIRGDYVFGCLRNASKHTKKSKGSIMPLVEATLQVEDTVILLNRFLPEGGPQHNDITAPVYLDVRGVVNKSTKGRNVRYRLAAGPGWECSFTILWDKTVVDRGQMRNVLNDASVLQGLGDGLRIGNGRFEVLSFKFLDGGEGKGDESLNGEDAQHDMVQQGKAGTVPAGRVLAG